MSATRSIVLIGFVVLCCVALVSTSSPARGLQQAADSSPAVPKRDYLLNGLQLIVTEQPATEGIVIRLRINSGAAFDLAGKGGLADLTGGMLLKGGAGLDARNVAENVEQSGLSLAVSVDWDSTNIMLKGSAGSLDTMIDLIARLVISPTFDQKELDALKAERIAAATLHAKDDADIARGKAMESLFGSHPYGRPEKGTPQSISQIVRADLLYYHKRFYIANNAAIVVSGNVKAEAVTQLARTRLGSWTKGEIVPASFRPPDPLNSRSIVILDRSTTTVHALIAQLGVSRRDKDYFAVLVMAEVLKANASKRASGLAGSRIDGGLEARQLPGPLWVRISSTPETLAQNIDSVLSVMTELQGASAPMAESVEEAKKRIVAAFTERISRTEGSADVLLDIETFGLGRDYLINFAPRVNAITPADVQRAAQNCLKPRSLAIVVSAPAGGNEDGFRKLGTVTVVR